MQVSIFLCQWKSCCVENCCLAQALDIRFDFLLRRHYMLCLFQCQSDSALTRTYWPSRGTAGRNSRFKLFLLLILGAFSFLLSAILNSQAGYRCTLVPRLPFPVPGSPFPVPRSPFPVLVTSIYRCSLYAGVYGTLYSDHFHTISFFLLPVSVSNQT